MLAASMFCDGCMGMQVSAKLWSLALLLRPAPLRPSMHPPCYPFAKAAKAPCAVLGVDTHTRLVGSIDDGQSWSH
eukprot:13154397-Alexandrium_andersonii.AAC.1